MTNKNNGLGIASFVLGIITIVFGWFPVFGLPFPLVGFVLGIIQAKKFNNGLNIAGIVLNSLGLILQLLMFLFMIIGVLSMGI